METFARRSTVQVQDLDRSQELRIFHESTEIK